MRNTNSANKLTDNDICSDTNYNIYDIDNADDRRLFGEYRLINLYI